MEARSATTAPWEVTMTRATAPRAIAPRLIAACTVVVVCLGFWGFRREEPAAPASQHIYRTVQLFVLESGNMAGSVGWQLEVARLGAPAMTVASAAVALAAVSRSRLDRRRARIRRGHVVVCGLGERGGIAATALHAAGHQVVGIDATADSAGSLRCRRAHIPVIVGDGRDPDVLEAAGVPAAAHLVVLTPALGLSGQIAMSAAALVTDRVGSPLAIHLEVAEPHLAALLHAVELTEHRASGWRLEELDLAGVGARAMLDEHAPWCPGATHAQVLVVGDTALGTAVAEEAARRWRRSGGATGTLQVRVVEPDEVLGHLAAAWPPVDTTYVCVDDEAIALATALAVLRRVPDSPVVVRVEQTHALAELLHDDAPPLHPVSIADCMLTPDVLLDSTVERIARALHDAYRRTVAPGDPAGVAWDRLPEPLRVSNRAHAADVATKVRLAGRVVLPDDGDPADTFTDDEVEMLARLEHERWVTERRCAGWTDGPRDATARTSPHLVDWTDLDDGVREVDRRFVRALPEILTDAGLVLRRRTPAPLGTRR